MDGIVLAGGDPSPGTPLAFLVTFLVLSVLYAVTAHLAARNVLGDVPVKRAALVGPVPAAIVLLLQQYHLLVVLALALIGDGLAIRTVYRINHRTAALVTVIHFTITVLLGLLLFSLFSLLATAPG